MNTPASTSANQHTLTTSADGEVCAVDGMPYPCAEASEPAAEPVREEVGVVTVPQLNNGPPTLVAFAVPFSATRNRGGEPMTFDEAAAVCLGPPSVLTKHSFDV